MKIFCSYEIWTKNYNKIIQKFPNNYKKNLNATYYCFIENMHFLSCVDKKVLNNFKNFTIDIRTTIHDEIKSKDQFSPQVMKTISLSYIKPQSTLRTLIYTDASKIGEEAGFGIYCPTTQYEKSVKLKNYCAIFSAEMIAIGDALKYVKENDIAHPLILTDSLSSCEYLKNSISDTFIPHSIKEIISLIIDTHAAIMWIPAHVGIEGNEKADYLAKAALDNENVVEYPISPIDAKKVDRQQMNECWQKLYDDDLKGEKFKNLNPKISDSPWYQDSDLEPKDIKIINRLISNHSFDKRWMYRFGKVEDEKCEECNEVETAEHLAFRCRLFNPSRCRFPLLSSLKSTDELWKSTSRKQALNELSNFLKENEITF